jgi:hypothetical protein
LGQHLPLFGHNSHCVNGHKIGFNLDHTKSAIQALDGVWKISRKNDSFSYSKWAFPVGICVYLEKHFIISNFGLSPLEIFLFCLNLIFLYTYVGILFPKDALWLMYAIWALWTPCFVVPLDHSSLLLFSTAFLLFQNFFFIYKSAKYSQVSNMVIWQFN